MWLEVVFIDMMMMVIKLLQVSNLKYAMMDQLNELSVMACIS